MQLNNVRMICKRTIQEVKKKEKKKKMMMVMMMKMMIMMIICAFIYTAKLCPDDL